MEQNEERAAMPLLSEINSPSDLRKLPVEQLPALCREIREFLISRLSVNPGHFASSMGAVELIVALHYVYDTPYDRLVWDVGHQAYAHKILTGRRDAFAGQRTLNGISGFPNPLESDADTFMAGHAGNSISAALGMAIADKLTPENRNRKTVAVIGDASISGGLAFEGLNNASNHPNDLLIVLNDNDMSIDPNVGALHSYLSDLTTSAGYNRIRNKIAGFFRKKGILTDQRKRAIIRFSNSIKSLVSKKQNIFEGLNIRYLGPMDGHDVIKLVQVFKEIKNMEGPRLLHVCTIKGKGYKPAEDDPAAWHAPGKFDPATGKKISVSSDILPPLWQDVFGETLVELAGMDKSIAGITAAMPSGTSMSKLAEAFPDRTFDVGISEGHAVTFAGGMAAAGKKPFVAIYSSFLQRAYDNIIHDVAIQGLPVTFCIDRAGLVGEDGVTHHGLFDLAYLNCIPGMKISSPADEETMRNLMFTSLSINSPYAIRYPRGRAYHTDWKSEMKTLEVGKGRKITDHADAKIAILTLGPVLKDAMTAASLLEDQGIKTDIFDMIWMKPIDMGILSDVAQRYDAVITVEDGALEGGFGETVEHHIREIGSGIKVKSLGVPDRWIAQGTVDQLKNLCGYDVEGIISAAKELTSNTKG